MAIARPIRVLGLIALALWVYFIYQIFVPAKVVKKGPGDMAFDNMDRDPNLDRMRLPILPTEMKLLLTFF